MHQVLMTMGDPDRSPLPANDPVAMLAVLSGRRQHTCRLHHPDRFPHGFICPALFHFDPINVESDVEVEGEDEVGVGQGDERLLKASQRLFEAQDTRRIWLWCR